jgi:hypothetical protein
VGKDIPMNRYSENSPAFQRWVSIKRIPEVPSGTTGPWKFVGASFVPDGTQHFHRLIFPALKRWAIFAKQVANWYQFAGQRDSLRLAS